MKLRYKFLGKGVKNTRCVIRRKVLVATERSSEESEVFLFERFITVIFETCY